MHPKEFLQITEANLLTDLGKEINKFFEDHHEIYTAWDEAQKDAGDLKVLYQQINSGNYQALPDGLQSKLFFKRTSANPASSVQPLAQLNMVANVTFHLLAQQLALVLHQMPELNRETVLKTTFENIRKLVSKYTKMVESEKETQNEAHDQGHPAQPASNS